MGTAGSRCDGMPGRWRCIRSAPGPFILNPLSRPFSGAWNKGIMSGAVSRCFLRHCRILWSFQGHFWVMHGAIIRGKTAACDSHPCVQQGRRGQLQKTTTDGTHCPNNNSLITTLWGRCGGSSGQLRGPPIESLFTAPPFYSWQQHLLACACLSRHLMALLRPSQRLSSAPSPGS